MPESIRLREGIDSDVYDSRADNLLRISPAQPSSVNLTLSSNYVVISDDQPSSSSMQGSLSALLTRVNSTGDDQTQDMRNIRKTPAITTTVYRFEGLVFVAPTYKADFLRIAASSERLWASTIESAKGELSSEWREIITS